MTPVRVAVPRPPIDPAGWMLMFVMVAVVLAFGWVNR